MPGFFGNQANRLLRTEWEDPNLLAQELYAMVGSETPLESEAPLVLNQYYNQPAMTINAQDAMSPASIVINGRNPNIPTNRNGLNGLPGAAGAAGKAGADGKDAEQFEQPNPTGQLIINNTNIVINNGSILKADPDDPDNPDKFTQFNFVNSGVVQSGSGSFYTVLLGTGETVAVKQLQIAAGESIPIGTAVIVFSENGIYKMQAPVWL